MPRSFEKDPGARLDYTINWSDWLDGDTISTSTWLAETGITVDSDTNTTTTTTVWLSGGTLGNAYDVTNRIVTAAGREDDRTIEVHIREK